MIFVMLDEVESVHAVSDHGFCGFPWTYQRYLLSPVVPVNTPDIAIDHTAHPVIEQSARISDPPLTFAFSRTPASRSEKSQRADDISIQPSDRRDENRNP